MSVLNQFLAMPRHDFDNLVLQTQQDTLCFIIDPSRSPQALASIQRLDSSATVQSLFNTTDFEALADLGPLWLSAQRESELATLATQLCQATGSGIALATSDAEHALAHARWLLRVNDGSGGHSLLSYYKPSLWAALMLTAGDSANQLLGTWKTVFSPAPAHYPAGSGGWLNWSAPTTDTNGTNQPPYLLPPTIAAAQRTLRWLYWIDEEHEAFGNLSDKHLPQLIDDLELLAKQGIYEGRHLLKLAPLLSGPALNSQEQIMAILQTSDEAFIKVERLLQLAATSRP